MSVPAVSPLVEYFSNEFRILFCSCHRRFRDIRFVRILVKLGFHLRRGGHPRVRRRVPQPRGRNKDEKTPAQIRQEQVRPDFDRNNDSDFEGCTLSQTLGAVATQSLFGKLVDRDDLPGNREGAASARRAGPAGLYGDHDGSPIQ